MISIKKQLRELKEFEKDPNVNISGGPIGNDLFHWNATIVAPNDTVYEGQVFHLTIEFSPHHPFEPPKVKFVTPCFHPNISKDGYIGIDILREGWCPALTISRLLLSISSLLDDPNPDFPMDPKIGHMYKYNRVQFDAIASGREPIPQSPPQLTQTEMEIMYDMYSNYALDEN